MNVISYGTYGYRFSRINIADPDGSEMRQLVDLQNEKRQKPAFDYAKLFATLEVIRGHQRIESLPKTKTAGDWITTSIPMMRRGEIIYEYQG